VTALLAIALAAAPAAPGGGGPVRVDAREVQYAFQKREVVFSGEPVTLTHEDARLTCRRLVAKQDAAGEIAVAVCEGDVAFTRGARKITCAKATYDAPAERLVCEGSPVLRDGNTEARGSRLVYDLRADQATLENVTGTLPGAEVEARRKALEETRERKRREAGR
jgi:lipopolysaccharide export system protein LptA